MFSFMAFNAEFKGGRVMQWIHDKQMANRYGKIASLQYVILLSHPTLLFLLFLFPVLAQATESVYEQQIQQARNGNYTPFLDYLQRYQQQHA